MSLRICKSDGEGAFLPDDFTVEDVMDAGLSREAAQKLVAFRDRLARRRRTPGPFGCLCQTLHERAVGDGCEECNPALARLLDDARTPTRGGDDE